MIRACVGAVAVRNAAAVRVRPETRVGAYARWDQASPRRRARGYCVLLTTLLCLTLDAGLHAQDRPRLPGTVVGVVDGDTVDVRLSSGMIRVRLQAIDAPERGQPYGDAAKQALARIVFGKAVDLEPYEQDRYDRLVARIWLGDVDVNAAMINDGYAWAYRRYLDGAPYCIYEYDARRARRGLWQAPAGQRVAPWEWRRRKTLAGQFTDYTAQTVAECVAEANP